MNNRLFHQGFEEKREDPQSYGAIRISLASPDRIREWSHGEIVKPETINYRTYKPEHGGLFCARTFGPIKDYECYCGKYKRMKHRNTNCEKCGVDVVASRVRRERMGHIRLASPVAHIWFLNTPNRISKLLDVTSTHIDHVLYCLSHIVTHVNDECFDQATQLIDFAQIELSHFWSQLVRAGEIKKSSGSRGVKCPVLSLEFFGIERPHVNEVLKEEACMRRRGLLQGLASLDTEALLPEYEQLAPVQAFNALKEQLEELHEGFVENCPRLGSLLRDLCECFYRGRASVNFLRDEEADHGPFFTAKMGAEAVRDRLKTLDLESLYKLIQSRLGQLGVIVYGSKSAEAALENARESGAYKTLTTTLAKINKRIQSARKSDQYDLVGVEDILGFSLEGISPIEYVFNEKNQVVVELPLSSLMTDAEYTQLQSAAYGRCSPIFPEQVELQDDEAQSLATACETIYGLIRASAEAAGDDFKFQLSTRERLVSQLLLYSERHFRIDPESVSLEQRLARLLQVKIDLAKKSSRNPRLLLSESDTMRLVVERYRRNIHWYQTLQELRKFDLKGAGDLKQYQQALTELQSVYLTYGNEEDAEAEFEGGRKLKDHSREWILLDIISRHLRDEMRLATSVAKREKCVKRLEEIDAIRNSELRPTDWTGDKMSWRGNKPEWMILEILPVLPPDLRPLVPLEGGRFATSDLNDLYRRVINRNNRLRRLKDINAPDIIIRNEKRMLQEAVDALFDNGRRGKAITGLNKRALKSLSGLIKGKQGRFRQNLLGKRVDYSGRSVIVVGPELRLHQCGLPKKMAIELFKPFIFSRLEAEGHASTIKMAKKLVEQQEKVVWDILDDVIREHPVLLNRAPTLHRLGIQAFEPKLIEGKAIQLHPLVCAAFNADFDGDQMAVHLPLSVEAQVEARVLMMSSNNILSPASGKPIIVPSQDIVLGCYYMTRERPFARGEGTVFANQQEVRMAYDSGHVALQAKVKCRIKGEFIETTVGRLIMAELLPANLDFSLVNKVVGKKELAALIDEAYRKCTAKETVLLADGLKDLGYAQATRAGISIALRDLNIAETKERLVEEAFEDVNNFDNQWREGLITLKERYNKVIDLWAKATDDIAKAMMEAISQETFTNEATGETLRAQSFNSVHIMADSGARGGPAQIRQLAGIRGLMAKPSGDIIETPITANFREGLSVLQYFISTHGARKGLADTALKTANSGYLTRRLVDVAQDAIVTELDCNTQDGIEITALFENGEVIEQIGDRVLGRILQDAVYDAEEKEKLIDAGTEVGEVEAKLLNQHAVSRVTIRSVLTCDTRRGVCAMCYGRDLARGRLVNIGEAVGVIAAQSIGEPGTQLTMRTFHIGGAASQQTQKSSISVRHEGSVRYEAVTKIARCEAINGATEAPLFKETGAQVVTSKAAKIRVLDTEGYEREQYPLPYGATLFTEENAGVTVGQIIARWDPFAKPMISEVSGVVRFIDLEIGKTIREERDEATKNVERTINIVDGLNPRVAICEPVIDKSGQITAGEVIKLNEHRDAVYSLPNNATLVVKQDGQLIGAGQMISKMPREASKTKDITGGLPRVQDLFEARRPKDASKIAPVDGVVEIREGGKKGMIVAIKPAFGEVREVEIGKGNRPIVRNGEQVKTGMELTGGELDPHDILKNLGKKELAKYLVKEIQSVYRLQGVKINDKHIELIVRQMLRRVRIEKVGDTQFLPNEQVEQWIFNEENARVIAEGRQPARGEPILLPITKASLSTESFISAASFQETTKVLTIAALKGKIDYLRGLKENVIMGRLIPAGTGLMGYRHLNNIDVHNPEEMNIS